MAQVGCSEVVALGIQKEPEVERQTARYVGKETKQALSMFPKLVHVKVLAIKSTNLLVLMLSLHACTSALTRASAVLNTLSDRCSLQ
jgi:hypothetical protein